MIPFRRLTRARARQSAVSPIGPTPSPNVAKSAQKNAPKRKAGKKTAFTDFQQGTAIRRKNVNSTRPMRQYGLFMVGEKLNRDYKADRDRKMQAVRRMYHNPAEAENRARKLLAAKRKLQQLFMGAHEVQYLRDPEFYSAGSKKDQMKPKTGKVVNKQAKKIGNVRRVVHYKATKQVVDDLYKKIMAKPFDYKAGGPVDNITYNGPQTNVSKVLKSLLRNGTVPVQAAKKTARKVQAAKRKQTKIANRKEKNNEANRAFLNVFDD